MAPAALIIRMAEARASCHPGRVPVPARMLMATGAVRGKRLRPTARGLLGFCKKTATNQKGIMAGRVRKPVICWPSLASATVAPMATIKEPNIR